MSSAIQRPKRLSTTSSQLAVACCCGCCIIAVEVSADDDSIGSSRVDRVGIADDSRVVNEAVAIDDDDGVDELSNDDGITVVCER